MNTKLLKNLHLQDLLKDLKQPSDNLCRYHSYLIPVTRIAKLLNYFKLL